MYHFTIVDLLMNNVLLTLMSSVLTLVNSVIVVEHSEQGFDVSEHCSVLILVDTGFF